MHFGVQEGPGPSLMDTRSFMIFPNWSKLLLPKVRDPEVSTPGQVGVLNLTTQGAFVFEVHFPMLLW